MHPSLPDELLLMQRKQLQSSACVLGAELQLTGAVSTFIWQVLSLNPGFNSDNDYFVIMMTCFLLLFRKKKVREGLSVCRKNSASTWADTNIKSQQDKTSKNLEAHNYSLGHGYQRTVTQC